MDKSNQQKSLEQQVEELKKELEATKAELKNKADYESLYKFVCKERDNLKSIITASLCVLELGTKQK